MPTYTVHSVGQGMQYDGCPDVTPLNASTPAEAIKQARKEYGNDLLRVYDAHGVIHNHTPRYHRSAEEVAAIRARNNYDDDEQQRGYSDEKFGKFYSRYYIVLFVIIMLFIALGIGKFLG